ncbi:MAG: winged helix-turn-helix domain-containing protein [Acidobacteria bacterium]|nr:winged helix-turn-helix domain-containing protein [Acidobacteriota bacterium]
MPEQGYRFDDFVLDTRNKSLCRGGEAISLNPKYFDVLAYLIEHAHELVTKDDMFETLWRDVFVTDSAITQSIKDIRRVLGDRADDPKYIKTLPKRGYMFIAETERLNSSTELPWQNHGTRRPFRFLATYTDRERDLFFGREQEIQALLPRILNEQSMVLYGRSGVGKSSLVSAGLLPHLKSMGHITSLVDHPNEFTRLLSAVEGEPFQNLRLAMSQSKGAVVIAVDQFELWLHPTEKLALDRLTSLMDQVNRLPDGQRVHWLLVVREDKFAELNQLKQQLPSIFVHEFRLMPLTRDQAHQAIEQPLKRLGLGFEPGLVDELIEALIQNDYIEPPALQIVCDELYNRRTPEGILNVASLQEIGGVKGVLDGYLQRVLLRFPSQQLDQVKTVLLALIQDARTRNRLSLQQIEQQTHIKGTDLETILAELCDTRLVHCLTSGGTSSFELVHDWIVPSIAPWLSHEHQLIKRAQKIMSQGLNDYNFNGMLLSKEALELVLSCGTRIHLSDEARLFLIKTALARAVAVPEWLAEHGASAVDMVSKAMSSDRVPVRLNAVSSSRWFESETLLLPLARLALSDPDRTAQRQALLMLYEKYGDETSSVLSQYADQSIRGRLEYTRALATLRDAGRGFLSLRRTPSEWVPIVFALASVRLNRARTWIWQCSAFAAISGGISGLIVGSTLALLAATTHAQLETPLPALWFALSSSATAIFMLYAMTITLAKTSVEVLSARHHPIWSVLATTGAGGLSGFAFEKAADAVATAFWSAQDIQTTGWLPGAVVAGTLAVVSRWQSFAFVRVSLACVIIGISLKLMGFAGLADSISAVTASMTGVQASLIDQMNPNYQILSYLESAIEVWIFGIIVTWSWRAKALNRQ